MGDGWSVAYRVLDAQFWGVPQRRRRIALVADFGGHAAPEILFVRQSVCGDTAESGTAGEEATAGAGGGVAGTVWCPQGNAVDREARQTIHSGALASQQSRPAPIWDGFKTEGGEITAGVFAGAAGATRTHQAAIVDGFNVEGKEVIGQTFIGGEMATTEKQAAIREGLESVGQPVESRPQAVATARAEAKQKPPAVREGISTQGETVTGAIVAATASNSKYKNTVKE